MSDSLRDQLLKAGLGMKVKTELKPARKPVPRPAHGFSPNKPPKAAAVAKPKPAKGEVDLAQAYAQRARVERAERDQNKRETERIAREKTLRKQKITALFAGKSLNVADADVPRHFPHGNKIRRIYCTNAQLAMLNHGDLAVVQLAGRYLLVTRDVALRAQTIDAHAVVLLCDPSAPSDDDVPADLVW